MAYVSKEMKAQIAPVVKALCKKYGVKGTLSVRNHSALVLTISQGSIDFLGSVNRKNQEIAERRGQAAHVVKDHIQVNPHWVNEHYDGVAREFLEQAVAALKGPDYFDRSDISSDYFHCSHYVDINIGKWDKPYTLTA
jgi:hypothetical protein